MKYKLYLFDMDLTLLDARESAILAYKACHKAVGDTFNEQEILKYLALPLEDTYAMIEGDKGPLSVYKDIFEEVTQETVIDHSIMYDDGLKLLKELHSKNLKLGIVTNRSHYCVNGVLTKYPEISNYIDVLITCENCGHLKPSPEPLQKAMEKLGCLPSETVYVGDALNDFKSAKSAGVDFICVNRYGMCNFDAKIIIPDLTKFDF